MAMNALQVECTKCKVASTCPRKGSSPMPMPRTANKKIYCHIIGGYGRTPIDKDRLGPESRIQSEKNGPCLTIAYVPTFDESTKTIQTEITKIFSQAVKHPRESVQYNINLFYPNNPTKTHGG